MLDEDDLNVLDQNISSDDFVRFTRAVVKLQLHMVLSEPPIEMQLLSVDQMLKDGPDEDKFEYWMYNKSDYYCIDGFPKEGLPCVVVLPPPFRQGYVYQGIKPAVIVLASCNESIKLHVRIKQEALLEKMK